MDNRATFASVKEACWQCKNCGLGETRIKAVFGEGPPNAEIFLLGEAPGAREDETGRPFVGRAGDLLTATLAEAGIDRSDVFITGSCKCRPPKNRNPLRGEVKACRPLLLQQFELIKPKIVVCMGLVAVHNILDPKAKIADVRGVWFDGPSYKIYVTYHPAAVLRGTVKRELLVEDFRKVKNALNC